MSDSKDPKNPRNAARNAALALLQAKYRDEYEAAYKAECEKRGLEYKPRLTAEERAKAKADERLAKAQAKVAALKAEFGEAIFPGFDQPEHLTEPTF
jgi:hypothetical protein